MQSKKCTFILLIFYLLALTWVVIFKLQFSFEALPHMRNINLIPFGESVIANGKTDLDEIILNVLVFVPFGLFLHILWKQKPWFQQFMPILCASLLFEAIQFLFAVGGSDITDLITNSCGGIAGILIAAFLSKVSEKRWISLINIISLTGAVLLLLLITVLLLANS